MTVRRVPPRNPHVWVQPPNLPSEKRGFLLHWLQEESGEFVGAEVLYRHALSGQHVTVTVSRDRVREVPSSPQLGTGYG